MGVESKSDKELLRLFIQGSESAGRDFYLRYVSELYPFILSILKNQDWAEEATQNLFLNLVQNSKYYFSARNIKVYLFSCARNEAYRLLKHELKPSSRHEYPETLLKRDKEPGHEFEALDLLDHMLRNLPEEQRETVILKCYRDFTFEEIAQIMNVSINTAMSRYRLAMKKLEESGIIK